MARGYDVIIPAGGRLDEEFARVVGVSSKSLITLDDVTVLKRTMDALRGCPQVGRIVVVGIPEVLEHEDCAAAYGKVPAVGSSPTNISNGLRYLAQSEAQPEHILIVTSDLPFLTSESLNQFLSLCNPEVDFNVPLVSRDDYEEAFPGSESLFVRLHDGFWTTGNVYLATAKGISVALPHLEEVFEKRKSKLKMAAMLGPRFVWDYMQKKLTVSEIERKVMEILGVKGTAIPGSPAELAFDIDDTGDYQYAVSHLKRRVVPTAEESSTPS